MTVISDAYFDVAVIVVKNEGDMDFCSILKLTRVDVGKVVKRVKIWRVLLLEVFLLGGFLTELCL